MYEFLEFRVCDVVDREPVVIGPESTLSEAEALFAQHEFNALPVISGR